MRRWPNVSCLLGMLFSAWLTLQTMSKHQTNTRGQPTAFTLYNCWTFLKKKVLVQSRLKSSATSETVQEYLFVYVKSELIQFTLLDSLPFRYAWQNFKRQRNYDNCGKGILIIMSMYIKMFFFYFQLVEKMGTVTARRDINTAIVTKF